MRILHVIRTLDPAWGGPVEGVKNITRLALSRGHTPEVLCIDDEMAPWLASWAVTTHAVGPVRSQYGFTKKLDGWLGANLGRFDVVIVHSIWMYFSYAVWKATRTIKVPYFLFVHGALDPWFRERYPLKHIKKSVYWKLFEHKILRDAESVLFTTETEMQLADGAFKPYRCNSKVTGYGISPPNLPGCFDRSSTIRELTALHPMLCDRNYILFLGRIHGKKGIDLLLSAFSTCRQVLSETALVIAGEGDAGTTESLKRLARSLGIWDDVVFTGPLYKAAKWDAIQAADAYILPSHQENFGISVVEALACGTPVLISNKVNIWRDILSEEAGLVAPDTVEGTRQLLGDWANISPQSRLEMSRNAKRCFARRFDISETGSRLFSMIEHTKSATDTLTVA
jgi:glycosyltransferase involved in cell wall biosynthesis